jgi:hypothetical protein
MKIEVNKWYLTAGGYLVYTELLDTFYGMIRISKETSVGLSITNNPVSLSISAHLAGWAYSDDGTVSLNKEWSEKLKIVSEFKHRFPTLPSEYKWKDGYPQFRTPKRGEYFVRYDHRTGSYGPIVQCDRDFVVPYGAEERRFIVEPVEKNEFPISPPKTLLNGYEWPNGKIEFRVPKRGEYYLPISSTYDIEILGKNISKACSDNETATRRYEGKRFIVAREGEKPATTECPDDFVEILDENHRFRINIDQYKQGEKPWVDGTGEDGEGLSLGYYKRLKESEYRAYRCKRKDLTETLLKNGKYQLVELSDKSEKEKPPHIPFDGPGQYELMNGQIVNLDSHKYCETSDNIKSGYGTVYSWRWEKDGTICDMDLTDHSLLYLKRKISGVVTTKPEEKIFGTVIANNNARNFLTKGKSYSVYEKSNGVSFLIKDDAGNKQYYFASNFDVFISSDDSVVAQTPVSEKKEEVMSVIKAEDVVKVTKATGGFVGRMSLKALNYWVAEPIKEVATKVMRGVRYVTLGAGIVGGIYTYNNPEAAKETFKKCLPKIEIKVEAPEIMNS